MRRRGWAKQAGWTAVLAFAGAAWAEEASVVDWPPPAVAVEDFGPRVVSRGPTVTVGGWARMALVAGRYQGAMPAAYNATGPTGMQNLWADRHRYRQTTGFSVDEAMLALRVDANDRAALHVRLRLNDADDGAFEQDDFLHAAWFEWRETFGQPLTFRVGKQEIPFGLHRDTLLVSPYIEDVGNSGFSGWLNGVDGPDRDHPASTESLFGVTAEWRPGKWRDLLSFEAAVFQNRESGARGPNARRRTDDNLLFHSFAGRMRFSPFYRMELSASVLSRYSDSSGNAGTNAFRRDARRNTAWSAGLATPVFVAPVVVFAEFQRSWRDNFVAGQDAKIVHFGAEWEARYNVRVHWQGEWMHIRRRGGPPFATHRRDERFWRTLAAVEYDFKSEVTLEAGWQREWYKRKGAFQDVYTPSLAGVNLERLSARGDLFYLGLKLEF